MIVHFSISLGNINRTGLLEHGYQIWMQIADSESQPKKRKKVEYGKSKQCTDTWNSEKQI